MPAGVAECKMYMYSWKLMQVPPWKFTITVLCLFYGAGKPFLKIMYIILYKIISTNGWIFIIKPPRVRVRRHNTGHIIVNNV